MHALDNLQLLLLATLHGKKHPVSRYEAMAAVNHLATRMDRPYSPGAVYHCIKGLSDKKMIIFNQKLIQISEHGSAALRDRLISAPLSESVLTITYEALALQLAKDPELKAAGIQRLKVELIKFNQSDDNSRFIDQESRRVDKALISCHSEIIKGLNRFVLELSDIK